MDLATLGLGVLAVNLGVFLGGCSLAAYRTWRDHHRAPRRGVTASLPAGRPSH